MESDNQNRTQGEILRMDLLKVREKLDVPRIRILPTELKLNARALDVCCGGRMFYYNKQDPRVLFCDIRDSEITLCDGRVYKVHPDVVADFRKLPFRDNTAPLIVFDPPHLRKAGENSWLAKKYGLLPADGWKEYLAAGFRECWRVLVVGGTLIFKWSEDQIKLSQLTDIFPAQPLLGNRTRNDKSIFIVFFKNE